MDHLTLHLDEDKHFKEKEKKYHYSITLFDSSSEFVKIRNCKN